MNKKDAEDVANMHEALLRERFHYSLRFIARIPQLSPQPRGIYVQLNAFVPFASPRFPPGICPAEFQKISLLGIVHLECIILPDA